MSESDTIFTERDQRWAAVQLMLSTDPSYDNRTIASTLKMKIWIATNNRDVPRVMKIKFPATVMVFVVVSSEGHIMPPHIFEVGLKVNTKVYLDVLKSVAIPCCNQVCSPGYGSRTRRPPTSPKRPRVDVRRSATTLYPSLTAPTSPDLNPLEYFIKSYLENITNMTFHNTKVSLIAIIRRVFTDLPPALVEMACFQFRIRIEAVIEVQGCYIEYMSALVHNQIT